MKFEVAWSEAARHELLDLHWRRASAVGRAVLRFAEAGVGNLRRVGSRTGREYMLRVRGVEVFFTVDRRTRLMVVWALRPAQRRPAARPKKKTAAEPVRHRSR